MRGRVNGLCERRNYPWKGATHDPVFNAQGDKMTWKELDEDGYESDKFGWLLTPGHSTISSVRVKIVIYDPKKGVRYTLTQLGTDLPKELAVRPEVSVVLRGQALIHCGSPRTLTFFT